MNEAEKIVRSAGITDDGDVAFETLVRDIESAIKRERTEAAAEMVERAAEAIRARANEIKSMGHRHRQDARLPDSPLQAFADVVETDVRNLSPDPDYSSRIRREVLEEAARALDEYLANRPTTECGRLIAEECAIVVRNLKGASEDA